MESIHKIVVFQIGTGYFGMEITQIEEIIKKTNAIAAPSEKTSNVLGILNLHEGMIPILNLYERLGIKPLLAQGGQYLMIISLNKKLMAFPIDKIEQYHEVPSQCLYLAPSVLLSTGTRYFQWIARIDGRIVPILDPEWLFKEMGESMISPIRENPPTHQNNAVKYQL